MFRDERLYNTPRWYLTGPPEDYLMLVPRELLQSVVFIGENTGPISDLTSTGFFVAVPSPRHEGRSYVYLVTADHCVRDRRSLFIRMNSNDGGIFRILLPDGDHPDWLRHPGPAEGEDYVDLAAVPVGNPALVFENGYRWAPLSMFFDEEAISDDPNEGVGVGDEVVTIGLLTVHSGTDQNEPVVRTGNLAMVPSDPILVRYRDGQDKAMRLYLTELRSIAGISGSPVFVRHRHQIAAPSRVSLLGVMIGHCDDPAGNHMGFGKVVPARLLRDVLYREEAVAKREENDRAIDALKAEEAVAHEDSFAESEFERFEDLTKQLVQTPKPEKDETES